MAGPATDAMPALLAFVARVRRAGVPASPDRVQACAAALDALGPAQLYWAGRLTLCGCADDVARYDEAYRAWSDGVAPRGPARPGGKPRRIAVPFGLDGEEGTADGDRTTPLAARASGQEMLRHRDLAELSTVERDEVRRLLALLRPAAPRRPARRYRAAPDGRVDPRGSLVALRRTMGEPVRLAYRRRRDRPRRLILLVDVSGSMAPYADALLRLGHAAVLTAPAAAEVFTFGTRLTRVTRALRHRDPDVALAAAGAVVPDWHGGTRLGTALGTFIRRYGHPGLARRAIVVVCSDGWERGDPAELAAAMARLRRLAHRVLWVTPHRDRPGFEPTAAGLAAVLPYLDALVAGHSLDALSELLREVGRNA
ncbi:MAG TPA: VWA domain-containing protein [Micromonosporaceae bacterium]|nr:VWA domain-containing protein [Micromonosporaceae bacterium]